MVAEATASSSFPEFGSELSADINPIRAAQKSLRLFTHTRDEWRDKRS